MNPTGPRYEPVVSAPTSTPAPAPAPNQAPSKASGNGGNGNGGKVAHVRAPRDSQSLRRLLPDAFSFEEKIREITQETQTMPNVRFKTSGD